MNKELKKEEEVKEEEVVVEEAPEKEEESTEEVVEEEASEDVESKTIDAIALKVHEYGKAEKSEEKKSILSGLKSMSEKQVSIYKTASGKDVTLSESKVKATGEWFQAFLKYSNDKNPDNFSKMKSMREKLEPLQTGSDAEGGYLVPTLLHSALIEIKNDAAVIKSRANVIDMTGMPTNKLDISGVNSQPIVSWNSETAEKGTTSVEFNQIELTPYILAAIVTTTTQLINSSPFNIVKIITKLLAEAIAKEEDRVFMSGTGTGQPTGIDTYTFPLVDAGGALSWTHFNTAFFRLPQAYRNKAYWIMSSLTMSTVGSLADDNNRPILDQAIYEDGLPRLKNRPILENNDFGDNKVFFIDLSEYYIGEKVHMKIDTADQATIGTYKLWQRNMIAIRVEEEIDGELGTTRAGVEIENVRT